MVTLIALYILLYILSMLIHEYGHMLGAALQGVRSRIEYTPYKKKIPSFKTYPLTKIDNDFLFDISGGVFAFIIYLLLFGLVYNTNAIELKFTLLSLGGLQMFYGIYEMLFLRKWNFDKYMLWHYVLYGIIIGLSFLVYLVIL